MVFNFLKNSLLLRPLEDWLTSQLLASRSFHKMVGSIHRTVHQIKNGVPPEPRHTETEEPGPRGDSFFEYFKEEIKDQMRGKPPKKL
ncbi:uncharacterized protein BO80DRAFT_444325 [Aspergillus ibericus CBS 121593]|uniref:Uncharacterized protein n=1 Tax=Aspergillus ibericus CBS 121593 TaxID=1448316 RepID=A0A395H1Z4_9EURO|nr:hypothetical protein BO80DRAFT_444325 [Aspergillus ibericus CBS 121593]RAL01630.1 hypothetical protein BO80DRAFT_444325 [Aspergillus ibericus CBS 121593]